MSFNPHQFSLGEFNSPQRDELVQLARLAETAERYDDMCQFMREIVNMSGSGDKVDLSVEERNLLSVAYKNVVGTRRASWRTITSEAGNDNANAIKFREMVEAELEAISSEILGLLSDILIPATKGKGDESEVFYLKMAGDYNRYVAEFLPEKGYDKKAAQNYEAAMEVATANLTSTHPIRLGLALNYSVCQYEILKSSEQACSIARKAFDDAISKLDELDEASYKDSTLIMQLLRDNLTLWTSEQNEDED